MTEITDEFMSDMLGKSKHYSVAILTEGLNANKPGSKKSSGNTGEGTFCFAETVCCQLSVQYPV